MRRMICVVVTAVIVVGAGQLRASNLVVNGEFELGNTGFTSDYTYGTIGDDYFALSSNPNDLSPYWGAYADHTSGSGKMMVVNGSTVANKLVWGETVSVSPNTRYNFSTWVSSCFSVATANLDFAFNGSAPIRYDAPAVVGVWHQFTAIWDSGANTFVNIQVYDRNLEYGGNDFALDDISLSPVLSGDANNDGKVDINDLTIVLAHYNQSGMIWNQGDFNSDQRVDINDLTIVLAHYNQTYGSGLAAVPEPAAITLLFASAIGLIAYTWRKRIA